ncbi:MAG TPA: FecR domain-containing protein [Chitinophaga sp.]|uniref:FecR domain-containing protein n=1 Tax=Chitinophaga sp. TaxID=1869181 RepID=UPI002C3E1B2D|nr:FecR domain-containing protein [Chitinophaga sp.]HVI45252.1 FecR domain-containing protein [Chitinophaga sp.]
MSSDKYISHTARDFALDEDFQQWVLHPEVRNVFWEHWLSQHPEKDAVVAEARRLVHSIGFRSYELPAEEKAQLWESVWSGLEEEPVATTVTTTPFRWSQHFWKYAAVLLLGLLLTGVWRWYYAAPQPVILSIHTRLGEKKTFMLPDSSEVTLNADSRLLYAARDHRLREVWLDGEAFFHVKHTSSHKKFIVHTYDDLKVEVLGTQFNVNDRGKEIAVVLQQGSIRLSIGGKGRAADLMLSPGEMLRYNKNDGGYTKSEVNATHFTSWHNGRLEMDDYSLSDAVAFMQQVFGKTLIVRDTQLLGYKVSGSMPIIYNADTMMVQLEKVFRMKFNQRGDEIWIQKK